MKLYVLKKAVFGIDKVSDLHITTVILDSDVKMKATHFTYILDLIVFA